MKPAEFTEREHKVYKNYSFINNGWDVALYKGLNRIRDKTTNPNHTSYKRFGGRGIEWRLGGIQEVFKFFKKGYYKARIENNGKQVVLTLKDPNRHFELGNVHFLPRSKITPTRKRVRCIQTGQIFDTMTEAGEFANCSQSNINRAVYEGKTAGKVLVKARWELVEE